MVDPVSGTKKEAQAVESQAIGRAYRQGQTKQVTVVRLIIKNTIEHITYMRNNDVNEDTQVVTDKDNKPQLVKSSSFSVLLANKPSLQRSGSVTNLLEGKLDEIEERGNNTNEMKKWCANKLFCQNLNFEFFLFLACYALKSACGKYWLPLKERERRS